MRVSRFFACLIGEEENSEHKKVAPKLIKKCLDIKETIESGGSNWLFNTYNTQSTYNICKDKDFEQINKFVSNAVKNYCEENRLDFSKVENYPSDGWLNVYKKGDSQEFHQHRMSIISAVYYLKAPPNSAKFYIKSPYQDMLNPNITEATFDNTHIAHIQPVAGTVIVFRSYLEHMVEQQQTDDERISLAYNFYKA